MESASGTVKDVNGSRATVAVDTRLACPRCAEGRGCGAGLFQDRTRQYLIEVDIPEGFLVGRGDVVAVTIGPRSLLKAALYAYALPLGGMLGVLAIAAFAWPTIGTPGQVLAAVTGLMAGFLLGRHLTRKASLCHAFRPQVNHA